MNISTVAGQPIEFWIAMVDADAQNELLTADSAPALSVASKNGVDFTPGGGEMVIGTVAAQRGYYMTFTPATLPAVGDTYYFVFNYVISSVTYELRYHCVTMPAGGGGSVSVYPLAGNAPDRIEQTTIKAFTGEDWSEPISGVDADGNAINFNNLGTLQFAICDSRGTEVLQIDDGNITTTSTTFTITIPESVLTYGSVLFWSLRDISDGDKVILYGPVEVAYAAKAT